MDNKNNSGNNQGTFGVDVAELIQEKVNFNIQNPNSKPLDISLMTGKNQEKGSEKK